MLYLLAVNTDKSESNSGQSLILPGINIF